MQNVIHHNFYIAFLLNGILFISLLCLFNPSYNTDVDIYYLYTLSGGYGNAPSSLLHYSYGAHPILGGIIAYLFTYFPGFNWYTFFLITFHFVCCVTLLFSFLDSFRRVFAIAAFIIFFLFIESRLLMGFNYSGTALIGAVSGSVSLLLHFANKKWIVATYRKKIFFFSFLILAGGLIRIHYIILFGVFAIWMGIFILSRKRLIEYLKIQLILGLLLVVFFQGQKYYYEKNIPQWQQEEKLRQAYFYIANHPLKKSSLIDDNIEKLKQDLVRISFLCDKNLVNHETIKKFIKNNVQKFGNWNMPYNFQSFYWIYMDLRVYLLLIGGVIIVFIINRNYTILARFVYMAIFYVVVFLAIYLHFKSTEMIILTFLTSVLVSAIICIADLSPQKPSLIAGSFLVVLSCVWMTNRIIKADRQNKQGISYARAVINELNQHPDILFIDAGTLFDFHVSIWDLPEEYPIHNLIYNELFLSNSYDSQLYKHGITDLMKEIPVKNNIYLVGQKASILVEYYKLLYNQTVQVKKISGFQYIDAYQITTYNNK
jgi:hypothetical protein